MRVLFSCSMLCYCLLFKPLLATGQIAEGNPPAAPDPANYIFYWGKLQCDLNTANTYIGQLRCTVTEFRQTLHSTPYLWTGAGLVEQLSFKLEGLSVRATRGGTDYLAQISRLDEAIGQKVVPGQVLRITEIELDGQALGRIDLMLDPAPGLTQKNNSRPAPSGNFLNSQLLEKVVWGREDIYENSNRDFFSETEFWQSIQQLPYLEWSLYVEPQPVSAGIQFYNSGEALFGMRSYLESYRQMIETLGNYRHLAKPGAVVTLTLHTTQHDRLFEKTMHIVENDDPRLALRRNRDSHKLRVKWGAWEQTLSSLYLLELKDARGNTLTVDPPVTVQDRIAANERIAMLDLRPEFWIDDQPVPDIVFRLSTPAHSVIVLPGQALPKNVLTEPDSTVLGDLYQFDIDSLRVPGYALPDVQFSLRYFALRDKIRIANTLDALRAAPGTTLVKLHQLVPVDTGYSIDLEFLLETDIRLSIFTIEGENVFSLDNKYPPGLHTLEIPRLVFKQPGKYYLFVDTAFGVAKQEMVLE